MKKTVIFYLWKSKFMKKNRDNLSVILKGMIFFILLSFTFFSNCPASEAEKTSLVGFNEKGEVTSVSAKEKKVAAQNVILLIGDGMGYNHVAAGGYYASGIKESQAYYSFPVHLGMCTYMAGGDYDPATVWSSFDTVNHGATDSAAAATAMAAGQKTYRYAVGFDCRRKPLTNIVEMAERSGRSSGVVTTVPFSHATPAAFVAHNVTRRNYEELAREMILNSTVDVIMGAGHPWYDQNGKLLDKPKTFQYVGGEKLWEDLQKGVVGNDTDGDGEKDIWTIVESQESFQDLSKGTTPKRVLGVARVAKTLQQKRENQSDSAHKSSENKIVSRPYSTPFITSVPTLEDMAIGALNVLDNNKKGFFLMIEGGAIDWASHANQGDRFIEEQVDFDKTVAAVVKWVEKNSSWDKTLVIVTADHETGYLTGPGSDPGWNPIINNGKGKMPGMEWHSKHHTNSLVPIFAQGPNSWRFSEMISGHDPERGDFIDNTALYSVMQEALRQ